MTHGATARPRELVDQVYQALATGDRETLEHLLHPDFHGEFSPGMPPPIGGAHLGAQACIENGWWAVGALFSLRAKPERWLRLGPNELLVLGTYRGRARRTGRPLRAPFAHLWTLRDDRLIGLRQYTDTALWREALEEAPREIPEIAPEYALEEQA